MKRPGPNGFTLIELAIVVAILAILAAIAVPNFLKLQVRSKQSEARTNLRMIFTAQRAFFQEKKRFSDCTGEIRFDPERNNRYAYFLGSNMLQDRSASTVPQGTVYGGIQVDTFRYGTAYGQSNHPTACGTVAGVSTIGFQATALGNIDADATIDQWSISSDARVFTAIGNCTADANNPAGEPTNDQNDVIL